jgi:hypothetical protein
MRRRLSIFRFLPVALLIATAPVFLSAQDGPPPQGPQAPPPGSQQAPPEHAVARISIINGQVAVRRGDSGDWVAGIVNAPLMADDRIATTGAGSRAEVQFDSANLIRIGANAEIRLAELDYGHYVVQIAHGTVTYGVLRDSQAQVELETPPVAIRPTQVGAYRIYVQPDGPTEVTVREGSAEIRTPKGVEQLQAGQTMLVRGTPADPEFRIVPAIALDEWDKWNTDRDQALMSSNSYRYVPQGVYGAEDLDQNGTWQNEPDYGYVWYPQVSPDWAPYQDGRWVWEDWYGWTWVGNESWGWAPFHYGRWFMGGRGWCWYPGFGFNTWSPGLVAFFGFGGRVGFGFGFGNVGWVPLAPFEAFHPWWGRGNYGALRSPAGFSRVNITAANIAGTYRNARVANGVSSVSAGDFAQGRFNSVARMNGSSIHDAGLVRGQLPIAPSAANLRFSNRTVANVPHSSENMHFFGQNQTAATQHVPFAQQQRAMQQYSHMAVNTMPRTPNASAMGGGANAVGANTGANTGAWSRATRPPTASSAATQARTESTPSWRPAESQSNAASQASRGSASGWQRFGEPRSASPTNNGFGSYRPPSGGGSYPSGNSAYRSYAPSSQPGYRPESIRIAPQVLRERSTYGAPQQRSTGGGGYSAPRSSGSYSAPRSSSSGSGGGGYHGGSGGGGGGSHGGGGHR